MVQNHPHRTGPDLRREFVRRLACHGSTFSRVGASGNPGAVQAVETILSNRPLQQPISEATLKLAWKDYGKLSAETAQRTLRFWQVHNKIEK
jgi:hypothetical protein